MSVPDYQQYMYPMLELLNNRDELRITDIANALAEHFRLSQTDLEDRVPSGKKSRHYDRVGWAATYLKQAGLLRSPKRAYYTITERGRNVLQSGDQVNTNYLYRFSEFQEFQSRTRTNDDSAENQERLLISSTPDEILSTAYSDLRNTLAAELLERILQASPKFFEQVVIDVLLAMGYGGSRSDAAKRVGQSGDGGIDGIINEDRLGLDVIYLQAKRWKNVVGARELRDFAGSLEEKKAVKGVFITTSDFTREAQEYVSRIGKRIVLINGNELAQFMIDFGVGALVRETYVIKKIDEDYFTEEQ